jgi:predicted subunit of tRNA(5-methylaminomethyl-2-thiouridylate) methyltransferase
MEHIHSEKSNRPLSLEEKMDAELDLISILVESDERQPFLDRRYYRNLLRDHWSSFVRLLQEHGNRIIDDSDAEEKEVDQRVSKARERVFKKVRQIISNQNNQSD